MISSSAGLSGSVNHSMDGTELYDGVCNDCLDFAFIAYICLRYQQRCLQLFKATQGIYLEACCDRS